MKITRHSDLSVRLLMYLAVSENRTISVAEVSRKFDSSRNHLGKIVSQLADLGYLRTMRGKGGGMRLARSPGDINIGEVLDQMEPPGEMIDCYSPRCALAGSCEFKSALDSAKGAFKTTMANYTLADMTRNAAGLSELAGN